MLTYYETDDIEEVYLRPLRSVLLIDDEFPTYEQLANREAIEQPGRFDMDTAVKLFAIFRERGLICDVENRAAELKGDRLDNLGKSDLIVLDYHLESGDSPEQALRIIECLADSAHANLVTVYTNADNLDDVRLQIALRLRQRVPQADFPEPYDVSLNDWEPEVNAEALDLYLNGDPSWTGKVENLRRELESKEVPSTVHLEIISTAIEDRIRQLSNKGGDRQRSNVETSLTGESHRWVHCQNVFIAIIAKKVQVSLIDELRECILAWSPPPLQALLARARNVLEQGGFEYERHVLGDLDRHVGWIYHAMWGEEAQTEARVERLLDRLFSGLQKQLTAHLEPTANRLLTRLALSPGETPNRATPEKIQQSHLLSAAGLTRYRGPVEAISVFHALNSFLCSDSFSGSHLRPGSVFCTEASAPDTKWWVCVAPACDLVPREPMDKKKSWKGDLAPFVPVDVLRLELDNDAQALKTATRCRHLFIRRGADRVTLRIADETSRLPKSETLFLPDRGTIKANKFVAYRIQASPTESLLPPELQIQRTECVVVAQLRPEYADRMLQESGFHGSRVGVDFAKML